jgi:hypothetical protein
VLTYFVAYHVPDGDQPVIGNTEIIMSSPIDSYARVGEIEQAIMENQRGTRVNGRPVVTNWILLSED